MTAAETAPTQDEWLDAISEALQAEDDAPLQELLTDADSAELAHTLESFPHDERLRMWRAAAPEAPAEVLLEMSFDAAERLGEAVGAQALAPSAEELDATELAELMDALSDDVASELLGLLDVVRRRQVEEVLAYDEETVGRVMHRDVVTVRPDVTVAVVTRYLKRHRELPANTDQLVVAGRDGRFRGTVRVLDLYSLPDDARVEAVMDAEALTVAPEQDQQELVRIFVHYDLLSLPVVTEDGFLVGRVVASDVMDLLQERTERAMLARAGLDEDEDLFAPLLSSARSRAVWLGINLGTAFLAAWVIGLFEATLDQLVALAVLMPIVASMGGIAGSQTLALAIRGLALGMIAPSNRNWLLRKELGIGALNGVLWSVVVATVAAIWFSSWALGLVIAAALIINMVAAALSGLVVPLTLDRLGFDPALSGSVVLTTVTDVVGFLSFLGLATVFLL